MSLATRSGRLCDDLLHLLIKALKFDEDMMLGKLTGQIDEQKALFCALTSRLRRQCKFEEISELRLLLRL